jgi:hypothetical protein
MLDPMPNRLTMCAFQMLSMLVGGCGRLGFDDLGKDTYSDARAAADAITIDANREIDAIIADSSGSVGCRSQEVSGEYTSDFESGLPVNFEIFQAGQSTATVGGGTANLIPSPDETSLVFIQGPIRNLLRRRFMIETVMMVDTNQPVVGNIAVTAAFDRRTDIVLEQVAGDIRVQSWDGSVYVLNAQRRYDAVADRWWQIREQSGTLFFETSSDGMMWNIFAQLPTPTWVANAYFEMGAGTRVSIANNQSRGQLQFDNLFDCTR